MPQIAVEHIFCSATEARWNKQETKKVHDKVNQRIKEKPCDVFCLSSHLPIIQDIILINSKNF